MFGAAAGFCGGALAGHQCQRCHAAACEGLATVQGAEPAADFKLLVLVLGASIPELETPGLLLRQRPRAEAGLGRLQRETCYAEYLGEEGDLFERAAAGLDGLLGGAGSCRVSVREDRGCGAEGGLKGGREGDLECPWRFGDTLTLDARVSDVTGPGLKVCLRADSEVRLGRLAVRLTGAQELGACVVDLRRRVLPSCVRARRLDPDGTGKGRSVWESPVTVLRLSQRPEGAAPPAHVSLSFGVTADPEEILRRVADLERPISSRLPDATGALSCLGSEPTSRSKRNRQLGRGHQGDLCQGTKGAC